MFKFLKKLISKILFNNKIDQYVYFVNSSEFLPPPLSKEEEEYYFRAFKNGDLKAKDKLIEHNLRLVVYVAKKYEVNCSYFEDLISIGCIGLMKAIDNFDLSQGVKFSTYAVPMIIGEIRRYLRDNNSIRVSRSLRDLAYKALQVREDFFNKNNKEPTINEIANSAPGNPNIEFGVIPNGSGNDFVRNFTNRRRFTDIDAQIDGEVHSFDLIKCNDNYCVNMVNIGFDCSVVIEADKFRKVKFISPGLSYIMGVVVGFFFKRFGTKMKIIFDNGDVVEKKLTLTAIGNGKFCGGGFKSAPRASLSDGLLDVCIIDKVSRLTFISLVGSYKDGTFLEKKSAQSIIRYLQTKHFKMEFEETQPICIDGEIYHEKEIDFTVVPGAFNFVIPKGSDLRFKDQTTD